MICKDAMLSAMSQSNEKVHVGRDRDEVEACLVSSNMASNQIQADDSVHISSNLAALQFYN